MSEPRSAATSVANSTLTCPGASSQSTSDLGDRLVGVDAVDDERLGHRDRRGPGARRHDLGIAGQRRNRREGRLLGQEGDQLELRVQPRFEPPVGLEQHALADHHRRVGLVRPERTLGEVADRRRAHRGRASASADAGRQTRTALTGPGRSPGRVGGDARDRPAFRDRHEQRAPGARRRPQRAAAADRSARTCSAAPGRRPARAVRWRERAAPRHRGRRRPRARRRRPSDPSRRTSARPPAPRGRDRRGRPRPRLG